MRVYLHRFLDSRTNATSQNGIQKQTGRRSALPNPLNTLLFRLKAQVILYV